MPPQEYRQILKHVDQPGYTPDLDCYQIGPHRESGRGDKPKDFQPGVKLLICPPRNTARSSSTLTSRVTHPTWTAICARAGMRCLSRPWGCRRSEERGGGE